eukprot:8960791-Lingulodinium_polyedra.AAC.1
MDSVASTSSRVAFLAMFFGRRGSISQLTFQDATQRLSAARRRNRASRNCRTVAPCSSRSHVAPMGRK